MLPDMPNNSANESLGARAIVKGARFAHSSVY